MNNSQRKEFHSICVHRNQICIFWKAQQYCFIENNRCPLSTLAMNLKRAFYYKQTELRLHFFFVSPESTIAIFFVNTFSLIKPSWIVSVFFHDIRNTGYLLFVDAEIITPIQNKVNVPFACKKKYCAEKKTYMKLKW